MVPRLPGTAAVRPGTHQFSYPRYGGTTYPDSPYSDAAADKKLSRLCRRSVTWKCAALVLLLVVLALAALVAYLLGTYHRVIFYLESIRPIIPDTYQNLQQKILRPSNGRLASLTNMAALWDYRHSRRSSDVILRHFFTSFC